MTAKELLRAWQRILAGRPPCLSIELTKECPLQCPGCYAYGDEHLGGGIVLNQVSDFKGRELVDRFMQLVDHHRPLHVSIVGGEPLVRFRELNEILPQLNSRKIRTQLVTSAVRPIPVEWAEYKELKVVVSIDGLPAEHDVRRKPATYERILKNIEGHTITVHCTVTRQMTKRPGYLREFMDFWCGRSGTHQVWVSLYTPQIGETSDEIIPPPARKQIVRELLELRESHPKLTMTKGTIEAFLMTPSSPDHCVFAKTTRSMTADLKTQISPCQFGGNPDCSQCGCMASAGLNSLTQIKLPGGVSMGWVYDSSVKVGSVVAALRGENAG